MVPIMWSLELVLSSGNKVIAIWSYTPSIGTQISKGPQRPSRRIIQLCVLTSLRHQVPTLGKSKFTDFDLSIDLHAFLFMSTVTSTHEQVTSASWRNFTDPENKHTLSHILEVDTLNHKLDPEEGKLYTALAITIHAPVPWFLRKPIARMC
ncbi:protein slowmo homolog isoform X2 [Tanacetum coccineum]